MKNQVSVETLVPFGLFPEMNATHQQPITMKEEWVTFTGGLEDHSSKFLRFYSGKNLLMRVSAKRSDCETLEILDPTLRSYALAWLDRPEVKEQLRKERKVVNVFPYPYFRGTPTWKYNLTVFLIALPFLVWPFFLLYLSISGQLHK